MFRGFPAVNHCCPLILGVEQVLDDDRRGA
jgi:hypothetical protein